MIVDFHAHVYPDWIQKDKEKYLDKDQTFKDLFSDPKSKMADVDKLIKDMDEDGVDISVIMGIGWTDTGLAREMNDYIIESVAKYPDRLVGYGLPRDFIDLANNRLAKINASYDYIKNNKK